MENEIMNVATEVMDDVVVTDAKAGIGTGTAIAIGAGIATAVFCGVKLVKTGIAKIKAKKAEAKAEDGATETTDEA